MTEHTACAHSKVITYCIVESGESAGLWACADCGHKFVPLDLSADLDTLRQRAERAEEDARRLREATKELIRRSPTDGEMIEAGWSKSEVELACAAIDAARTAIGETP